MDVLEFTQIFSRHICSRQVVSKQTVSKSPFRFAPLLLVVSIVLTSGCASEPPARDEIPNIKTRISELESYYAGKWEGTLDSLMGRNFAATSGDFGAWSAITVNDEVWGFQKFSGRSFFYTQKNAEVDIMLIYMSPDSVSDTALQVKINLEKNRERWLVTGVKKVKPLVY